MATKMLRSKVILNNQYKLRLTRNVAQKSTIAAVQQTEFQQSLQEIDNTATGRFQVPFARAKIGPFFQQQPKLGNQFLEDVTLQKYLKRFVPQEVRHRSLRL